MAKYLNILLVTLTVIAVYQAEASVFNMKKCPKNVKPMDNVDIKKMAGAWYPIVASKGVLINGDRCFRTTIKIIDSGHFQNIYDAQNGNVAAPTSTVERTIDPSRPGVISHQREYEIKDIFGRKEKRLLTVDSYVLYTDYTNIELRYSCIELDNFWESDVDQYFYITVRNRSFDSVKQILPLLGIAKELGFDLNELVMPSQQSCISEF